MKISEAQNLNTTIEFLIKQDYPQAAQANKS